MLLASSTLIVFSSLDLDHYGDRDGARHRVHLVNAMTAQTRATIHFKVSSGDLLQTVHLNDKEDYRDIVIAPCEASSGCMNWLDRCMDATMNVGDILMSYLFCSVYGWQHERYKMDFFDSFTISVPFYDRATEEEAPDVLVRIPIEIRVGDELGRIVWDVEKLYFENVSLSSLAQIASVLHTRRLHEVTRGSAQWINARRSAMRQSGIFERFFAVHESSSSGEMRETLIEGNMHDLQSIWKHITLGLTTCKRLHHYLETIDALQKTGILELLKSQVIVIDDGSSLEDRIYMESRNPEFTFVWKGVGAKGHAKSMNLFMRIVTTRYFLYIEDDWKFIGLSLDAHVLQAICILQHGIPIPIHEVLFNEQSQRPCSLGNRGECNMSLITGGGWLQSVQCLNQCAVVKTCSDSNLSYSLHEPYLNSMNNYYYAINDELVHYRDHSFRIWPGLSLNPGVWDLQEIKRLWATQYDITVPIFNESITGFEAQYSLKMYHAGANMAYLHECIFQHIGTDISAYSLNDMKRSWD